MLSFSYKKLLKQEKSPEEYASLFFQYAKPKILWSEYVQFTQKENTFYFSGALFRFAWNGFHFLNGISKGQISFSTGEKYNEISYKIYFTEVFIISLIFSLLPVFIWSLNREWSLMVFMGIWLVLYGGNCIVSIIRFHRFIRRGLQEINKPTKTGA